MYANKNAAPMGLGCILCFFMLPNFRPAGARYEMSPRWGLVVSIVFYVTKLSPAGANAQYAKPVGLIFW